MFRKMLLPLLLPAVVLAMPQSVCAEDAAAGRKLAEQWCAKCHNIDKGAPFKLNRQALHQLRPTAPPMLFLARS